MISGGCATDSKFLFIIVRMLFIVVRVTALEWCPTPPKHFYSILKLISWHGFRLRSKKKHAKFHPKHSRFGPPPPPRESPNISNLLQ